MIVESFAFVVGGVVDDGLLDFCDHVDFGLADGTGLVVLALEVGAELEGGVEDLLVADLLASRALEDGLLLVLAHFHGGGVVAQLLLGALEVVVVVDQVDPPTKDGRLPHRYLSSYSEMELSSSCWYSCRFL